MQSSSSCPGPMSPPRWRTPAETRRCSVAAEHDHDMKHCILHAVCVDLIELQEYGETAEGLGITGQNKAGTCSPASASPKF